MKMKKKIMILIIFILIAFLSVGYATLQTNLGITGNVSIKGSNVVTFNANGGSVNTSTKKVVLNSTYGTLPTPTRSEYEFSGWYTSASGGTKVTDTTKVTNGSNHTLYAHWIRSTLLFSGTGADYYKISEGKLSNDVYSTDLEVEIESGGYTVKGSCYNTGPTLGHIYFTNVSGTSTDICSITRSDSSPKTGEYVITSAGTLIVSGVASIEVTITESKSKVNFRFDGYMMTYNANGGQDYAPGYSVTTIAKKGDSINIAHGQLYIRAGYTLIGYSTDKNATVPTYSFEEEITPTSNMTLYAIYRKGLHAYALGNKKFTIIEPQHQIKHGQDGPEYIYIDVDASGYNVEYNLNSGPTLGKIKFTNNKGNVTYEKSYSGSSSKQTFNITEAGTLEIYGAIQIQMTEINTGANVSYAWDDDNYKVITYNPNGGQFQGIAAGEKYSFKVGTPVKLREGKVNVCTVTTPVCHSIYTLLGWDTNKDAKIPKYAPGETITLYDDITLYAIWTNTLNYTITGYSGDLSTKIGEMNVGEYNSNISIAIPQGGYTVVATASTGTNYGFVKFTNSTGNEKILVQSSNDNSNPTTTYKITEAGTLTLSNLSNVKITNSSTGQKVDFNLDSSYYTITLDSNG